MLLFSTDCTHAQGRRENFNLEYTDEHLKEGRGNNSKYIVTKTAFMFETFIAINPFLTSVPILYFLKTPENLFGFLVFSGVIK